ncbi:hypothetical protein F5Y15DRAFT_40729 [Xylariaceae sp. FL0016]|nr:hypothetical protein F5Y15DRAFT_40729 [Xylariaceae sp. FL0016]
MPGEEMEISTDLGHPGFGEDIDIDIDFGGGQPDEDMDLGDFDQNDIQNFNSDTRDELMAEGDDASYGMVDADDIDRNETAAAANDIEIDIGDSDQVLWQDDLAQDEAFRNDTEIDYVEDETGGNGDAPDSWASTSTNPHPESVDQGQIEPTHDDENTLGKASLVENEVTSVGVDVHDYGSLHHSKPTKDDETDPSGDHQQETSALAPVDTSTTSLTEGVINSNADTNESIASPRKPGKLEVQRDSQGRNSDEKVIEEKDGQITNTDIAKEQEESFATQSEHDQEPEDKSEEQDFDHHDASTSGLDEPDIQTGNDSYTSTANEQLPGDDNALSSSGIPPDDNSGGPEIGHATPIEATTIAEGQGSPSAGSNSNKEPALSVAVRHEMFISYGETDYKLFAKSEGDDPNQYFLSDMTALELPLAQFLSSLREVISEEISPLDELVLHVDGLGLEFSESTGTDFLEKFTFGDILNLFDQLVKNDEADPPPDLYSYLMVRPNCSQRLVALMDSANTGRGLSEVAVYRESTPFGDDHASEVGSHGLHALSDDEKHGSDSDSGDNDGIIVEGDGIIDPGTGPGTHTDEYDGADHEGEEAPDNMLGEAEEHDYDDAGVSDDEPADDLGSNAELDEDNGLVLPSAEALNKATLADSVVSGTGQPYEDAVDGIVEHSAEDLIDFSEDELDVSPPQPKDRPNLESTDGNTANDSGPASVGEYANQSLQSKPTAQALDAPNSDNTSATATLNGDDHDEIDYSDDEDDDNNNNDAVDESSKPSSSTAVPRPPVITPAAQRVPIEDEITWESENDESRNQKTGSSSKEPIQVSSVLGRRDREDGPEDSGESNDNKRRRS